MHTETVREQIYRVGLEKGLRQGTVLSYVRLLGYVVDLDQPVPAQPEVISKLWELNNVNTRRSVIIALRSVFGWQIKIPRGVPRRYQLPSEDTLRLALMTSPHEVRGLLMMYGGLRIGEACAVTEKDCVGDRLTVDKQVVQYHQTGQPTVTRLSPVKSFEASIVIPHFLVERLGGITSTAKPDVVRESLRRAGKKVGIDLNPHQLRKWYVTELIKKGAPLELVRKQARHSDISITLTHYQQFNEDDVHKYFS